jgi:hypothetical protein
MAALTGHRLRIRVTFAFGLVMAFSLAAAWSPPRTAAAGPFSMDLYFGSGYESQVNGRACTAASAAMMLNFIARRDLGLNQLSIMAYEQPRDALNDATQLGSDPLGWSRALTHYASKTGKTFTYAWEAYNSEAAALKRAAKQIAVTGKPVGLEIWNGRHAVVMTGFEASRDPRLGDFVLTYVWISDPFGSRHERFTAAGSPLNAYLELDATTTYDSAWYRKFVIVVPQGVAAAPKVVPPPPTVVPPPPTPIEFIVRQR